MFLRLTSNDFSWSRIKKAFPVFLLLWCSGLVLALLYVISVRTYLRDAELADTETLLQSYLASHRTPSLRPDHRIPLQGLAFIRVVQGNEHLFLVQETSGEQVFKKFVDLPYDTSGVWLKIGDEGSRRILTVITREEENGLFIQAGKDARNGYDLYRKFIRYSLLVVTGSLILLWPVALYYIKLSLSPLTSTRNKIADIVRRSETGLLPERGNGPELDELYGEINQLIRHNRHLISEMQDSLDNVAHDLRTPMTRLRSVAEYGLQAESDTGRLREALSDCLEESERVLSMLRIMMSVAEANSGTMRLELENCDLLISLEQVVSLYEYVAEEKNIVVQLPCESRISVEMDKTRISQVWANLLDNAIKYGRHGGRVAIELQGETAEVLVSFRDNGIGIAENEQERIWERLYRGDRSRSEKGLGLGLNYVRAVVEAHGGHVSVTSTLHEGSCFEVRLPLAQLRTQEKSQISGE